MKIVSAKMIETHVWRDIDGSMQERRNFIANTVELRLSCANPPMFTLVSISIDNFNKIDICQVVSKIYRPDWWLWDVRISGVGTTTSKQVGIVIAVDSQTGVCVIPLWGLPSGTALCQVH